MDSSASEPVFPVPFYGIQSKKRNLNIQHTLENCTKRLKNEKIPNAYHSRILGPSTRWQMFYRQNEALDFSSHKTEDLHVFAFECRQPDKQSGQRQFLTAAYSVFWHYYMQLDESQRHHYEVIPEGHPCKLYFDLEFHKPINPGVDGKVMVDTLIKYVCCWLWELYNVRCNRDNVLELTASTETKFSRHLIFQLEGNLFKDNVTAGDFVHAIFGLLEDHLHEERGHEKKDDCVQEAEPFHNKAHKKAEVAENSAMLLSSLPSNTGEDLLEKRKDRDVHDVCNSNCDVEQWVDGNGAVECNGNTETNKKVNCLHCCATTDSTADLDCCACEDTECSVFHSSAPKDLSPSNETESVQNSSKGTHQQEEVQCLCKKETLGGVCGKHPQHTENDHTCEFHREKTGARRKIAQMPESFSNEASLNVPVVEGKEEQIEVDDLQISRDKMTDLCDKVFKQFKVDELRALFVKDKEGKKTCFADLGVYTKNRNFRLYKSCKLGKTTAFAVAEDNSYSVADNFSDNQREREIFLASLITNTRGGERLLSFGERAKDTQPSHNHGGRNRMARSHDVGDHIDGYGKSPYPEVDDFISSLVSDHGGAIRRWLYLPSAEILSYDIIGYRFCHNVQRQHSSNNIKLVADLQKGVWYQKCYDPDCQAVSFKSEEFKLPGGILPASYFTDDFENVEDGMDEDDEICLLALQHAEQGLTSTSDST